MRLVLVVPMKSFNEYVKGEAVWVRLTETVAHLIANDYLRLMWDTSWGPHGS